jgi:hypothetical protein
MVSDMFDRTEIIDNFRQKLLLYLGMATGRVQPAPARFQAGFRSPTSLSKVEVNSITKLRRIGAPMKERGW